MTRMNLFHIDFNSVIFIALNSSLKQSKPTELPNSAFVEEFKARINLQIKKQIFQGKE